MPIEISPEVIGYEIIDGTIAGGRFTFDFVERGVGLSIGSRESSGQADTIRKDIGPGVLHTLIAQFRIDDLQVDDAPALLIFNGPAVADVGFAFTPRRWIGADPDQRPVAIAFGLQIPIGSVALPADVWHELRLTVSPVPATTNIEIWRIDGADTLVASHTYVGTTAPIPFDGIGFENSGTANPGAQTSGTTWANISAVPSRVIVETEDLADVVRRVCLRTGQYTEDDIDVTALEGIPFRAMAVSQVVPARQTLETLMTAYLFEFAEGEKLKAVLRGGSHVMTIPYEDLGTSPDGTAEPLPKRRVNDIEIAAKVSVRYANVYNDFQDGLEAADRLVTESTSETVIELPIGLTPPEAKKLADANTLDLAVSLLQIGPVALPRSKYAPLEPTDVVRLTAVDGSIFRARIAKLTDGGGVRTAELVLDDASAVNSEAETSEEDTSTTLVRSIAETKALLLDIPALRDADTGPGFYVAAKPVSADGYTWAGYELDKSPDGVVYAKVYDSSRKAVFGMAVTALGDFGEGNVLDSRNTLTVDVGAGTLSSTTFDAMLTSFANPILVGREVLQYRTATFVSAGVYTLSGFLRGRRGTEWAMDHGVGERVVFLEVAGLNRVADEVAHLDVSFYWKAVTHRKSRAAAMALVFADSGVSLKPFAPVDLERVGDTVTWRRRSRMSSRFLAEVDPPLGEATEAYDVELLDGDSDQTILFSTTVTTPSFDLDSDGLGASFIRVYQKSAIVGRGYSATLEL